MKDGTGIGNAPQTPGPIALRMPNRQFRYASATNQPLRANGQHAFAQDHAMCLYRRDAVYTMIPKNGCTTMRLSLAIDNGCLSRPDQIHWIHANNDAFRPGLRELQVAAYTFVVLRCPFTRLVSAFVDKIVSIKREAWNLHDALGRSRNIEEMSFAEFVGLLQRPGILAFDIHWRPQVDFLVYEAYDDYFALERFAAATARLTAHLGLPVHDARSLSRHGISHLQLQTDGNWAQAPAHEIRQMKREGRAPAYSAMYTPELVEQVRSIYGQDLALYARHLDSTDLLFPESA